jgi:hypothetical protein
MARLTQHREVILAILFQHASVIKDLGLLLIVPRHELLSFRLAHFGDAILFDARDGSYIV